MKISNHYNIWTTTDIREQAKVIDLSTYHSTNPQENLQQFGCTPISVPIPKVNIDSIYNTFDRCLADFNQICKLTKNWESDFAISDESKPFVNVRFGIRDKRPDVIRKKDQKFYLQFCREYGEWVIKNRANEINSIPDLKNLFEQLLDIEKICQKIFVKQLEELAGSFPELQKMFYEYNSVRRVPISMRIISYENCGDFSVSPHYDKAALSLLLPSDDDPQAECLIVGPADGTGLDLNKLKRPIRPLEKLDSNCSGLLITGALLEYIGIPIPPTPHAVLPHNRKLRHVLVAFCNVPYLDTTHLNYALLHKSEIPQNFNKSFE